MIKKSFLSLILVMFMGVTLMSGCGNTENSSATEEKEESKTEVQTDENANIEDKEEYPGFEKDSIIGVSLPWLGTQNWTEAQTMFTDELTAAGYTPIIKQADQKVETQQEQIQSMIDEGAKVIVVGPVDSTRLSEVLEKAKSQGIYIIGYDRILEETTGVDGVVQYSSLKTGEIQAKALLEGLEKLKGEGPYNIELFGGSPTDPNAPNFFKGAMAILQPMIDDGTIVVVSGETDFETCATEGWNNEKARERIDKLLKDHYSDKDIAGVLCPNDGIARTVVIECENAGQQVPVVSGLDAEDESVKWVWQGRQYSTVAKPTSGLVKKTMEIINSLQAGKGMPGTSASAGNGRIVVPIYELPPVLVTKENAQEVFEDDPARLQLLN